MILHGLGKHQVDYQYVYRPKSLVWSAVSIIAHRYVWCDFRYLTNIKSNEF